MVSLSWNLCVQRTNKGSMTRRRARMPTLFLIHWYLTRITKLFFLMIFVTFSIQYQLLSLIYIDKLCCNCNNLKLSSKFCHIETKLSPIQVFPLTRDQQLWTESEATIYDTKKLLTLRMCECTSICCTMNAWHELNIMHTLFRAYFQLAQHWSRYPEIQWQQSIG